MARLDLVGLDEPATLELIEHWSDAAPSSSVAHRLVAATGGNPLALTELAATLDSAVLGGTAPLPDPLPVARGVEAAFLDRVRRLPEATRAMLLLAALEPGADLALLARTAEAGGATVDDLEAAEVAGLVRLYSTRVTFDHPLVRSAVEGRRDEARSAGARISRWPRRCRRPTPNVVRGTRRPPPASPTSNWRRISSSSPSVHASAPATPPPRPP